MFPLRRKILAFFLFLCLLIPRVSSSDTFICAGALQKGIKEHTGVAPRKYTEKFPTVGSIHTLVIFAKFKDEGQGETTAPEWSKDLFREDFPGGLRHFYQEMSFGQFTITGTVLPKMYSSEHDVSYFLSKEYKGDETPFGEFNREILNTIVRDRPVNFADFDKDGDGFVDYIFINMRTVPPDFIMASATGIATLGITPIQTNDYGGPFGKIFISAGSTQKGNTFNRAVGTMAHEFGHFLGLPDLYNTNLELKNAADDWAGIGNWGLMAHGANGWLGDDGSTPFCSWSRAQLGWIGTNNSNLVMVTDDMTGVVIGAEANGGNVYKIKVNTKEYFLISNRQPSSSYYERNLPKGGLLILHIKLDNDNSDKRHKIVDVECADGLFRDRGYPLGKEPDPLQGGDNLDFWSHSENYTKQNAGNFGDATDVFDGLFFTSFTSDSNPNTNTYLPDQSLQELMSGISVSNIRAVGSNMVADLRINHWSGRIRNYGVSSLNTVVWSGDIRVFGDIIVEEGVNLYVKAGTWISFMKGDELASGSDPSKPEVIVYGNLGLWLPERGNVYTDLTMFKPYTESGNGDWFGIRLVGEKANLYLENVRIEGAVVGLSSENNTSTISLLRSNIIACSEQGIRLSYWKGDLNLENCELRRNGSFGLVASGGGTITLKNCLVQANGLGGVKIQDSQLQIFSSIISENKGNGVEANSCPGKLNFQQNKVQGNEALGALFTDSDTLYFNSNVIAENNEGGTQIKGTFVDCNNNTFSQNLPLEKSRSKQVLSDDKFFGLKCINAEGTITNSKFKSNIVGLWTISSNLDVKENSFTENNRGLRSEGEAKLQLAGFNSFTRNYLAVENIGNREILAENNWWGSVDPQTILDNIQGLVKWQPYLTTDPFIPQSFALYQNFPNPFNSSTTIRFQLPLDREDISRTYPVILKIYNFAGKLVRILTEDNFSAGFHNIVWDGRNEKGDRVASGSYLCMVIIGNYKQYIKMLVLK